MYGAPEVSRLTPEPDSRAAKRCSKRLIGWVMIDFSGAHILSITTYLFEIRLCFCIMKFWRATDKVIYMTAVCYMRDKNLCQTLTTDDVHICARRCVAAIFRAERNTGFFAYVTLIITEIFRALKMLNSNRWPWLIAPACA